MDTTALKNAGLKENETKIYIALLERGSSLVSGIYQKTGVHRRNIYDALEKLHEKGLVAYTIKNGKKYFEAVNPERLLDYVKEKEEGIQQILPLLQEKYNLKKSHEEGLVFKGIEGIKSIMQDMLHMQEPIYVIGGKGKWLANELRFYFPHFERERIKRKIKTKQIFDFEMRKKKLPSIKYGEHRFFPRDYSSSTHIWVYGDRVVSLFWGEVPFAFMVKSDKISQGYRNYFKLLWKLSRE